MTDTPTQVRFPCEEHGVWFRHMVKPDKPGRAVWCEGGTTKLLRLVDGVPVGRRIHYDFYHDGEVWMVE